MVKTLIIDNVTRNPRTMTKILSLSITSEPLAVNENWTSTRIIQKQETQHQSIEIRNSLPFILNGQWIYDASTVVCTRPSYKP